MALGANLTCYIYSPDKKENHLQLLVHCASASLWSSAHHATNLLVHLVLGLPAAQEDEGGCKATQLDLIGGEWRHDWISCNTTGKYITIFHSAMCPNL